MRIERLTVVFCILQLCAPGHVAAQNQSTINQYILANGHCSLTRVWEQEFRRPDQMPFGKPISQWGDTDYRAVRQWIETCLDPFSAAPGRRELVMTNVDARLANIKQTQRARLQSEAHHNQQAAALEQRRGELSDMNARYSQQLTALVELQGKLLAASNNHFMQWETLNLDQLSEIDADITKVSALADQANDASRVVNETWYAIRRLSQNVPQPPPSIKTDRLSQRVDQLNAINKTLRPCGDALEALGVPRNVVRTRVLSTAGINDPYLFQFVCPKKDRLVASNPSWLSKYYTLETRDGALSLDFELVKNDPPKPARLVLRRLKSGKDTHEAKSGWEAINLLDIASAAMLLN